MAEIERAEKIGVLGGSFNPVHNGHMSMARGFLKRLGLSCVLLIPVWSPPHKSARGLAPASERLAMCRLACEGEPRIEACPIEIERGGVSYTADTLAALAQRYPRARFYLITGADMFLTLESWRNFPEIARRAVLCACARREGELAALRAQAEKLTRLYGASCRVEDLPVREVSSTQVRALLEQGGGAQGLLPPEVERYIAARGLYRGI